MEAIKKQAQKLREQVAKQQQAVLKHLGHLTSDSGLVDDAEPECHQRLQNLYMSTRAAKHFQRNVIRGVEGVITVSLKQMEIVRKLAEDCCKYGAENESTVPHVARVAHSFGTLHNLMEDERDTLLSILGNQVSQPLRALITSAHLEDARLLTHRYDRLRHEVDLQAAEVLRRRSKIRESDISAESAMKLRSAEARLNELKSTLMALGKEATTAMLSVETRQQQITLERLFAMVDAERTYHQRVIALLEKLYAEMILEEQLQSETTQTDLNVPHTHESTYPHGLNVQTHVEQKNDYFIAKVVHPFDAQAEGELSLSIDDYVVVRQVTPTGWSEGECDGRGGWFPSAYVEPQEKVPVSKVMEPDSST